MLHPILLLTEYPAMHKQTWVKSMTANAGRSLHRQDVPPLPLTSAHKQLAYLYCTLLKMDRPSLHTYIKSTEPLHPKMKAQQISTERDRASCLTSPQNILQSLWVYWSSIKDLTKTRTSNDQFTCIQNRKHISGCHFYHLPLTLKMG